MLAELAVVVEHELHKALLAVVGGLLQLVWRAVCEELLGVGSVSVVHIEIVFLAEGLIVVITEIVAVQCLGGKSLQGVNVLAEVEIEGAGSLELLLLVLPVTGDVGSHHCHGILIEVETVVVEHGMLLVGIGRIEDTSGPVVADDVHGTGVRVVLSIAECGEIHVELEALENLGCHIRTEVVLAVVQVTGLEEAFLIDITH